MAEPKTRATAESVDVFLDTITADQTRDDCRALMRMMKKVTGAPPKMWGTSIVGFGKYHYRYASGHEGDSCLIGFSPRKAAITLYVMPSEPANDMMQKLGKHKAGKGCLYIKKLEDVDSKVLEELMVRSVKELREKFP